MPTYRPRPTGNQDQDDANDQIFRLLAQLQSNMDRLDNQLASMPAEMQRTVVQQTRLILREQIVPGVDPSPGGSPGALVYIGSDGKIASNTPGTTGQAAVSGGSGAPTWQTTEGTADILTRNSTENAGTVVTLTGTGTFTQPRQFPTGSSSAPGVAISAANTGWYIDTGTMILTLAGTPRVRMASTGALQLEGTNPTVTMLDSTGGSADGWLFVNSSLMVLGIVSSTNILTLDLSTTNATFVADVEIDGDLDHDGSNVGFFGTAPAAKATVTGSRAGNAALASLLTALAGYGLVTDSSTA